MIQIDSSVGLLYDPRLTDPVRRLYLAEAKMEVALNKAGAITLIVPEGNPGYGRLQLKTSEVWALQDGEETFRGQVREIHENLNGLQEVVVEGLKSCLKDEQLRPYTKTTYGSTVQGWLTMAVNTYNTQRSGTGAVPFSVGSVDAQALEIEGKDYKDILSAIDNDLLKAVGGYLYVVRSGGYNVVSWSKTSGPVDDQIIQHGVNLTAYKRDDSAADIYTAVIPLGKSDVDNGKLTIKTVNGGSDMLVDATAAAQYGLIVKVFNHSDIETAAALKTAGQADLADAGKVAVSFEVSAVDLRDAGYDVGRLQLGHQNYVQVTRTGTPVLLPISRISTDLLDPGSGRYTFTQEYQTLTQQQSSAAAAAHAAQQTADAAATPESVAQQIAASEQKYADYVTETGSNNDGWNWRKWNSGRLEMWAPLLDVTPGAWSSYATNFATTNVSITLPVAFYDLNYACTANVSRGATGGSAAGVFTIRHSAVDSLLITLLCGGTVTGTAYKMDLYLSGRWK